MSAVAAIAMPPPIVMRIAARSGGAPPRRAPNVPSSASRISDTTAMTAMRAIGRRERGGHQRNGGADREAHGRDDGGLHRAGHRFRHDAELVAHVAPEWVFRHE